MMKLVQKYLKKRVRTRRLEKKICLICLMFTVGSSLHLLKQTWWFESAWHDGTQHGVSYSYREVSQGRVSGVYWRTALKLGHEGAPKKGPSPTGFGIESCPGPLAEVRAEGDAVPACARQKTCATTLRAVWRRSANVHCQGRSKKQLRGSSEILQRGEHELPAAQRRGSQKPFGLMEKMGSLVLFFFAAGEWLVLQLQVCK